MTASVELHDVIAAKGMAPLSGRLRSGEVVRIDGPRHAVSALLDVIAGRRAPRSGRLETRGGARILVRDGERTAAGVETGDAIAMWVALASPTRGPRTCGDTAAEDPAARGLDVASPVWIVDGALAPGAERIVQRAAEAVRTGDGLMVWTGASRSAGNDRVIVVELDDHASRPRSRAPTAARRGERARAAHWPWRAALRFAAAAATARSALAVAAVVTLWIAACAATVAAHEGFWYAPGSAGALDVVARLSAMGAIAIAATAAAARAAAAAAWPAMLRETGASSTARALVLLAGDAGGAAFPALVAALPAMWARDSLAAIASLLATIAAAAAAATITRAARMW